MIIFILVAVLAVLFISAHEAARTRAPQADPVIAGLLALNCPACGAEPGSSCTSLLPGRACGMIRVSKDPVLLVHWPRAEEAITAGLVRREDVLAGFGGGDAPDWLKAA